VGASGTPASAPAFSAEIDRDRKRLLLKSVRSTSIPTIGALVLVSLLFWDKIPTLELLLWLAASLGVAMFRYLLALNATTDALATIGEIVTRMDERVSRVAAQVRDQGQTTASICSDLGRVAGETSVISDSVSLLAASASRTEAAAKQLAAASHRQIEGSRQTMGRIEAFLERVKALG
jgi:methyl-accepting chemotaxis protein